ncbi:PH domain-containing protein [Microbacterium sp. NPDC056052]|uniref:PH domain-containing protein n=1 Tax=Microbacterium sp. NPDC056052 TaxID=3345695 RepID=UPI0035E320E3
MDQMPVGARTYRASTGIAVLVVCTVVAVFLLGDAVVRGSWAQMLLYAPWVLLVLWLIYVVSVVSMVHVDEDGATVQNFLRRTAFGWHRVTELDLRWQLDFALDDGRKLACWGGPGRIQSPRLGRRSGELKVPQSLQTLTEVRTRWENAVERPAGTAGKGVDAPIRRSWDWPAVGALVAILAWAAIAVAVTR